MKSFNVALLQLLPEKSIEGNLKKGLDACRKAKLAGADLALFPEMWSTGYNIPENMKELKAISIPEDSEFIRAFQKVAQELEVVLPISFYERSVNNTFNSIAMIDADGSVLGIYRKTHSTIWKSKEPMLLQMSI